MFDPNVEVETDGVVEDQVCRRAGDPVRRRRLCERRIPGHCRATGQTALPSAGRARYNWSPPAPHLAHRTQANGPTVVALPALGGSCTGWVRLQRALSEDVALCLYDRGGLGWSDHGGWPRTAEVMADELHQLLVAAAVPAPYVLAGNSTGGLIARMYTARYPAEVAGLALVDSSHPEMLVRLREHGRFNLEWSYFYRRGLSRLLRWNGVRRALVRLGFGPDLRQDAERDHPPDMVEAVVAEELSTRYNRAAAFELFSTPALLRQVRDCTGHLDSLPLLVITAGDPERSARPRHLWLTLQDELAALSTDSEHLVAEQAGHFVQADDPTFVADALRQC